MFAENQLESDQLQSGLAAFSSATSSPLLCKPSIVQFCVPAPGTGLSSTILPGIAGRRLESTWVHQTL
jgi:hypothetical protein